MDWYALFVIAGKEEVVQGWLCFLFDENVVFPLIPKRRLMERKGGVVKDVLKIIFPGYVFICTNIDVEIYYRIKNIPYIVRMLNMGEYCSKIEEEEMSWILNILDDDGIVDYSKAYINNSKIIIESGPLKGKEGLICAVNKRKSRVKIKLELLGVVKEFYLGIEVLPFALR